MAEVNIKIPCWYYDGCRLRVDNPDCRKTCYRYLKMNYLIVNCGKPDASKYLKDLKPSEDDKEAFDTLGKLKDNIVDFVEEGMNLFLSSSTVQTGKTTWSLKLMYKFFDRIWGLTPFETRGYFVYVPEFLSKCKSFQYKETPEFKEIDNSIKTADLVIWDDITFSKLNDLEQNTLNMYISKRIQDGKANIFNGNLPDDLTECVGKTLAARFSRAFNINLVGAVNEKKKLGKFKCI